MKQKLIYRLLVILHLVIISSCAVDHLNEEQHSHQHKNFNIEVVHYRKLLKSDNRFRNLHDKVLKDNSGFLAMQRGTFEQSNGFTIVDSTDVKILVTDSITSYTVFVEKDNPTAGAFNNLVLQVRNNGSSPRAFLMEYRPTVLAPLQNGALIFEGYLGFKDLPFEGSEIPVREESSSEDCGTTTYIVCTKPWNSSGAGSGGHIKTDSCNDSNYLFSVTVKNQCIGGGGGGNGINSGASNILNLGNLGFFPGFFASGAGGISTPIVGGGYFTPSDPDDITNNPITSVIPPRVVLEKTPCNQIKTITNSTPTLKDKINNFKTPAVLNLNHEKGFNFIDDAQNITALVPNNGNPNSTSIEVIVLENGSMSAVLHSHFDQPHMLPTFTFEDLMTFNSIFQWRKFNQKPLEKLTLYVVTRAGVFAMIIEDEATFQSNGFNLWTAQQQKLKKEYMGNLLDQETQTDEQIIAQVTKSLDTYGVGLYKADDNLNNWNKLTVDADNNIIPVPCN